MTDISRTQKSLNELLRNIIDSADGYEEAATVAKDPQLRDEFRALADERRGMAAQLRMHLSEDGRDATGTMTAGAHRLFMNLRAAAQDDTHAAIAEVERGEDHLRDRLREVLQIVSSDIRTQLEPIASRIQAAHDRWSTLKHKIEGASQGSGGDALR